MEDADVGTLFLTRRENSYPLWDLPVIKIKLALCSVHWNHWRKKVALHCLLLKVAFESGAELGMTLLGVLLNSSHQSRDALLGTCSRWQGSGWCFGLVLL